MKELSMEEKAKRYDEAIKKVNDYYEGKTKLYSNVDKTLDYLFPELKENEDEKMLREIKRYIKEQGDKPTGLPNGNVAVADMLAWLEKQGDTNETINRDEFAQSVLRGAAINLITWIDYNTVKGNMCLFNMECKVIEDALVNGDWDKIYAYIKRKLERVAKRVTETEETSKEFLKNAGIMGENGKLADEYRLEKQGGNSVTITKCNNSITNAEVVSHSTVTASTAIEPKFKVGDYLVNDYCKGKVIALTDDAYLLDTEQGIPFSYEHNAHLWTIQDAKDGDVLAFDNDNIVIFKDLYNYTSFHSYCHIEDGIFDFSTDELPDWWEDEGFKPATREQRDLLFQKMHEAGYEWDADKKELKKIEQKPAWNEYAEELKKCRKNPLYFFDKYVQVKLKEQKYAWSETDERNLKSTMKIIKEKAFAEYDVDEDNNMLGIYGILESWLKSLKERMKGE